MSRYDLGSPGEDEHQPGSQKRVLRNKPGLIDPDEIDKLEASLLVVAQARSFGRIETDTGFNLELIRDFKDRG